MRYPGFVQRLTSGMAYTKLPIGFIVEPLSPGVVVERKTIVDVLRGVRWMCMVVCGVLGSGKDSSIGFRDGLADSGREGGWLDNVVVILYRCIFRRFIYRWFLVVIVDESYFKADLLPYSGHLVMVDEIRFLKG